MGWIEVVFEYATSSGAKKQQIMLLNLANVRAIKKQADGRAMVLFTSGDIPAAKLIDRYEDVKRQAEQHG